VTSDDVLGLVLVGDRHTSTVDIVVGSLPIGEGIGDFFFFLFTLDLSVYRAIDAVVVYVL
jgi:hypothetical protein